MATIAVFSIGADEFPLGVLFESLPDATVELERVVPVAEGAVPYLWVHGPAEATLLDAVTDAPGVSSASVVDSVGDEHLLRVEWDTDRPALLDAIVETGVTLLSGEGTATAWRFEVRGESHEAIAGFERACVDAGVPVELVLLHTAVPEESDRLDELTGKQREALRLAHEMGYFDSPRTATLGDVAEELGISRQALASRVRRGLHHLVGATLLGPDEADD